MRQTFNTLYDKDPCTPSLDKTMSGSFQPGSTFKPFSALAALEDKARPGRQGALRRVHRLRPTIFKCTHVHGKVNMHGAIAESCNIYFAKVAEAAGMDRIARMATEFGLGSKTGLGINPEAPGRSPDAELVRLRYRGQFRIGLHDELGHRAGRHTVTPLQLALAYAALGNGGTLYSAADRARRRDERRHGRAGLSAAGEAQGQHPAREPRPSDDALYGVVNEPKGTAYPVRDPIARRRRARPARRRRRRSRGRRTTPKMAAVPLAEPRVVRGVLAVQGPRDRGRRPR
jgi:penicillin-binding protein 2